MSHPLWYSEVRTMVVTQCQWLRRQAILIHPMPSQHIYLIAASYYLHLRLFFLLSGFQSKCQLVYAVYERHNVLWAKQHGFDSRQEPPLFHFATVSKRVIRPIQPPAQDIKRLPLRTNRQRMTLLSEFCL
jgi:hypothetical protein